MELVVTSDSRGMRLGYESSVVVKVGDDGSLGGGGARWVGWWRARSYDRRSVWISDPLGQAVRLTPIKLIIIINIARPWQRCQQMIVSSASERWQWQWQIVRSYVPGKKADSNQICQVSIGIGVPQYLHSHRSWTQTRRHREWHQARPQRGGLGHAV